MAEIPEILGEGIAVIQASIFDVPLCTSCLHFYNHINTSRLVTLMGAAHNDREYSSCKPDNSEIALYPLD
ncbi:MAG: hypothetical protein P8P30_09230 [Rickettsiales bacterium]|nr:hypothetical protein [Rickettsiales bacterium]